MSTTPPVPAVPTGGPVTLRSVVAGFSPWHPLVQRHTHFEPVVGLQVAIAFIGPAAVTHFSGRAPATFGLIAFGGFLTAIVASAITTLPDLVRSGPGVAAAVPAAVAITMVADGWARVPLVAAVGVLVGRSMSGPLPLRRAVSSLGIALVLATGLPSTAAGVEWTAVGGAWGLAVIAATWPLARRARPSRAPRPQPVTSTAARHHGIRLAVGLAISTAIAEAIGESTPFRHHATWISVGVWIVLQPHLHETSTRGVQRAVGTALGGVVTFVMLQVWPDSVWIGWPVLVCTFLCFGIRAANYSWYCVALTPVVVLGTGTLTRDAAVLEARVLWTVVGTLLALVIRFTMWPLAATRDGVETARTPSADV